MFSYLKTMDMFSSQCPSLQRSGYSNQIFSLLLQSLAQSYCDLSPSNYLPEDYGPKAVFNQPKYYDFIIVGAGSAGSVIANRLSENPQWNILLVEAGGDPPIESEIPLLYLSLVNSKYDWQYETEPDGKACLGFEKKSCPWPRGKMLGGSSSMNAQNYIRGTKLDFDSWESDGNPFWGWNNVSKYFEKNEQILSNLQFKDVYGKNGSLKIDKYPYEPDIITIMIKEAAKELGQLDLNEFSSTTGYSGYSWVIRSTAGGRRQSTAKSFLAPIKNRPNLHIIKHAHVKYLKFNALNNKVVSIDFMYKNTNMTMKAKKEVILSAGCIGTSHILMLSGIGPSENLKELQISVVNDLAVGKNLQDHAYVPIFFKLRKSNPITETIQNTLKNFFNYLNNDTSIFSTVGYISFVGYVNTINIIDVNPDIQLHYVHFPKNTNGLESSMKILGYSNSIINNILKHNQEGEILLVFLILLKPHSKGYILLKSADYRMYPKIYANYLNEQNDIDTFVRAIKFGVSFEKTEAFTKSEADLMKINLPECDILEYKSDDYWKCYSGFMINTLYHPVGTAKMGPISDKNAVVDPELKVYGIENLRVCDASIMPKIISANTNAATIMIGEKCSDFVKNTWLKE